MFIADIRGKGRYVVVEAPSVASGPDVYTLAHAADATLLVVEAPRARRDDVADAVEQLDRMGTSVHGAVLMPSPAPAGKGDRVPAPGTAVPQIGTEPPRRALNPATAGATTEDTNGSDNRPPAGRSWLTDDPDATVVDIRREAGEDDTSTATIDDWAAGEETAGSLLKG
jgi:hypothetical protein